MGPWVEVEVVAKGWKNALAGREPRRWESMSTRKGREGNTALSEGDSSEEVGFQEAAEEGLRAGSVRRWSFGGDASAGEGELVWELAFWLGVTSEAGSALSSSSSRSSSGVSGGGDAGSVSFSSFGLASPLAVLDSVLGAVLCFLFALFFSLARLQREKYVSTQTWAKKSEIKVYRFWNQTWMGRVNGCDDHVGQKHTWTPRAVIPSCAASSLRSVALGFVSTRKMASRTLSWAEVVRRLCLTSLGVYG